MKVRFDYFKVSGKWAYDGEAELDVPEYELGPAVQQMLDDGKRPGIVDSKNNEFFVVATPVEAEGVYGIPRHFLPTALRRFVDSAA